MKIKPKNRFNSKFTGDIKHLCAYESEQLKHNVPIMFGIHGLQRLYNTTISPIVVLRSVGLQLTQTMTPLKVNLIIYFFDRNVCVCVGFSYSHCFVEVQKYQIASMSI